MSRSKWVKPMSVKKSDFVGVFMFCSMILLHSAIAPLGLFLGAAIAGGIALAGALIANLIWKDEE